MRDAIPENLSHFTPGPFKFLDSFQPADFDTFGGRDEEIEQIVARLAVDRTVILYGASGLGKTSLILAGIFPALPRLRMEGVYARVLANPLEDVKGKLEDALGKGTPGTGRPSFLLVLDQFEELFVRFPKQPELHRELAGYLAAQLGNPEIDLRILMSLREDFLPQLDVFRESVPGWFASTYRLRPLTAFGAREAITRPLLKAGIRFDSNLVGGLLDLLEPETFDSLMLQIACCNLLAEAQARGRTDALAQADLESIGDLDSILQDFVVQVFRSVPAERLLLTRNVLDAMVTDDGVKRTVTAKELTQGEFTASLDEVESTLELLKANKIVRAEPHGSEFWYELSHDRLGKPLNHWFTLNRAFAEFRDLRESIRKGARDGTFRSSPERLLARGYLRKITDEIKTGLKLTPEQKIFMLWSAAYHGMAGEVAYWSRQISPADAERELLAMSEARRKKVAAASMFAIPCVLQHRQEVSPALLQRCYQHALDHPSEAVRRAAGQALVSLPQPQHRDLVDTWLRADLRQRSRRDSALEVCADFAVQRARLKRIGWRNSFRARRLAEARMMSSEAGRTSLATRVSLLAAACWALFVSSPFALVSTWLLASADHAQSFRETVAQNVFTCLIVGLAGVAINWVLCQFVLRSYERRKTLGYWSAGALVAPLLFLAAVVLAGALIFASLSVALGNAVVLCALVLPSVVLLERYPTDSSGRVQRWAEILLACGAVPLFTILAASYLPLPGLNGEDARWLLLADFYAWSFTACCISLVLQDSFRRFPLNPRAPGRRLVRMAVAAATVLTLGASCLLAWRSTGRHGLPMFPAAVPYNGGSLAFKGTARSLSPVWPPLFSGVVDNPDPRGTYLVVQEETGIVFAGQTKVVAGGVLYLPPGRTRLQASGPDNGPDTRPREAAFALKATALPSRLTPGEGVRNFLYPVDLILADGIYRGTLDLANPALGNDVWVLSFLQTGPWLHPENLGQPCLSADERSHAIHVCDDYLSEVASVSTEWRGSLPLRGGQAWTLLLKRDRPGGQSAGKEPQAIRILIGLSTDR